jgi:hypothetical protein
MKLVKSLLLGSAAGIAAVAGAQAADLPSRKAAPVEYVRVCSAYGAGFFYIPGTETCLRVGGRLRAEYTISERFKNLAGQDVQDGYGSRARGRINIDARTATAYGTLRTFIRYDVTVSTGNYNYGALNAGANPATNTRAGVTTASGISLDKGFIQFGPITAGRAQSFFDFYANDLGFSSLRGSDHSPNLLAYTATFGSGFSATLSLEDRSFTETTANALALKGQMYPDLVGSLRVDQAWGSAQLSGAITDRSNINSVAGGGAAVVAAGGEDFGFAIQGGVKVNLPMLAAGDYLWLQAAYAEGAIGYLGYGNSIGYGRLGLIGIGDSTLATIAGVNTIEQTKGFAITAGLRHYWTPTIRSEIYGSYSELDFGRALFTNGVVGAGAANVKLDPKEMIIGTNLVWTPVSGLDIGVEVLYSRVELKNRIQAVGRPNGITIKNEDVLTGRLRIQRDF